MKARPPSSWRFIVVSLVNTEGKENGNTVRSLEEDTSVRGSFRLPNVWKEAKQGTRV